MTLQLDARQRAMLAEMGVRVWLAQPPAAPAEALPAAPEMAAAAAAASAPAGIAAAASAADLGTQAPSADPAPETQPTPSFVSASAAASAAVAPMRAAPRPPLAPQATTAEAPAAPHAVTALPDLTQLDLPALRQAAAACQACALCAGRQHSVWSQAAAPAADGAPRWLFVLDQPGAAENTSGLPTQGDAGKLLANMAAAVRLRPEQVLRSHATRCAPTGRYASQAELAQCAGWLRREIALLRPQVIVALGRQAAYALLQRSEPLGELRGQVYHLADAELAHIPVIVSYPLDYLLRNPPAKARTWQDLCLAQAQLGTARP